MQTATLCLLAFGALGIALALPAAKPPHELKGQELVDFVNKQGLWKAALHARFEGKSKDQIRQLLGARKLSEKPAHLRPKPRPQSNLPNDDIPASFDAREHWNQCTDVIGTIHDQAACGSCWAVSAAAAMSDRVCIATNGTNKTPVSAVDIMACCSDCGDGCEGGWPYEAFYFWSTTGVVSGSDYQQDSGCKPYPFAPCEHHTNKTTYGPCGDIQPTPKCQKSCQKSYTQHAYNKDKVYATDDVFYSDDVEDIQREIMTSGSVVVAFDVYEDFLGYTSGVYQHIVGELAGGHAIRAIGWGTENGKDYWLCLNQWNADWGDNGAVKILRGVDECGIEDEVTAAVADVSRLP